MIVSIANDCSTRTVSVMDTKSDEQFYLNTIAINSSIKPPSEDRFRFYQCVFEPLSTHCYPINNDNPNPVSGISNKSTRILPIQSWVPKIADKAIIRYRLFMDQRLTFYTNKDAYTNRN